MDLLIKKIFKLTSISSFDVYIDEQYQHHCNWQSPYNSYNCNLRASQELYFCNVTCNKQQNKLM